ncbi:MAG: MFS transporter [Citromicrobium sp.]|nr:MFS transporter [Citromicrobium sp.]MAO96797.1 MFS transporter [Citromicrobium sp.]MAO97101.1 MFS transporter [Citromicrobium sp.]MAS84570.1 MFS transporter [Erythrobacteraceae bacterium]MBT47606.1 MFS transporter [Citromicrobium sp.]|tara:strand:+ start:12805 stop:13998 length:1194 start_codon:yes stop_codon:yes gene_type:complete
MATDPANRRQTTRFLLLYALAVAGGAIAYVPFLTILLPIQVTGMAGDRDVTWLAYATFAGALAASAANIFFGWLSDRSAVRRPWIIGGLVWSCALLVGFAYITDVVWLIAWLVLWQMGLNMMLSALAAWAGDTIPDRQKGLLGGLLAFAPAAGALSASLITLPDLADAQGRLWLVAMLVAACVLPAVLAGAPRPFPELMRDEPAPEEEPTRRPANMVVRMWLARLLIQISEAALFAFLYFWFRSVDPAMTDANVARIFSVILVASVPLALLTGHLADRYGRPFLPLAIGAAISAVGLVLMALSNSLTSAIAGYVVFGIAASTFLSLHTGQTLRILPRAKNRARDLGIFNLTNTSPSLVMPWLAIGLVPAFGFSGLFIALAACAAMAALLIASLSRPT